MSSSIGKSTTIVVAGDAAGPSKLEKASSLGLAVWDKSKWMSLLKEYKGLWNLSAEEKGQYIVLY